VLRSDNGLEFVSKAWLKWAAGQNLDRYLIDSGQPWQNGTTESFHKRIETQAVIDQGRLHEHQIRPHSSLGNHTPAAFKKWGIQPRNRKPFSRNQWYEEIRKVTGIVARLDITQGS
jgi:transposase InsO family protein